MTEGASLHIHFDGPATAHLTVALAHGAGAPMDSPFMDFFARALAEKGIQVARFEFPYMARRRAEGGARRPPDRAPVLIQTWRRVIDALRPGQGSAGLVIGGKSMGGRIASLVADEAGANGLLCLGFPFHPPGRPAGARIDHLAALRTPTLVLQGTRDPFGKPEDVAEYALSPSIRVSWLPDGDHGFAPRRSSGRTEAQNWQAAASAIHDFLDSVPGAGPGGLTSATAAARE